MKRSLRRAILTLLSLMPIASVSYAAAIAKGREAHEGAADEQELNAKGGDNGGQGSESNVSER
jgi:hypothetical protein